MERNGRTGRSKPGMEDVQEWGDALRTISEEARDTVVELAERLEIERRMRENPLVVLGAAAAAGFVLGGGLWPALRPLVKTAARAAMSPANLIAIAAAVGALRAAGEPDEVPATEPPASH